MEKSITFNAIYEYILSEKVKDRFERFILFIAIISFLVHLGCIFLYQYGYFNWSYESTLLSNPISAIYTPFSFILIYEIYLLVYYLPRSITTYITKQYEIITLIIIRRLFKDLANLELTSDWFSLKYDLQFTYDILSSLILFFLISLFFKNEKTVRAQQFSNDPSIVKRFIFLKRIIAFTLVPMIIILGGYSFFSWFIEMVQPSPSIVDSFSNINHVFFDEFFTILIIVDVILLLVSFFFTDQFHKVIRNSGFVISTILIRLSFSVEGLLNNILILTAVIFGWLILVIYNRYDYWDKNQDLVK